MSLGLANGGLATRMILAVAMLVEALAALNDTSALGVARVSSTIDDELDDAMDDGTTRTFADVGASGTDETECFAARAHAALVAIVDERRRDDECSLPLPRCFSSNERKKARAFSTALFVEAEC
jgi:hypothetical protein